MQKPYSQNSKFRIVSGSVSFYATAKQIRDGVGCFSKFNRVAQQALLALESDRTYVGHTSTIENVQIQIDLITK